MAAKRRLVRDPAGSLKFKIVTVSPSSSDHLRNDIEPPSKQKLGGGGGLSSGSSDEYGSTATSRRQLLVKLRVNKERLQQKMTENKTCIRSAEKRLLVKLRVTPEHKERLLKKRSTEKDERKRRLLLDYDAKAAQAQLLLLDYYGYHCHQHQIKMMSRRGCVQEMVHCNTWRDPVSYGRGQIVY